MTRTIAALLLAATAVTPAAAQGFNDPGRAQRWADQQGARQEARDNRREVRESRREVGQSRAEVQQQRREVARDVNRGNLGEARRDRGELRRDQAGLQRDRAALGRDRTEAWRDRRAVANGAPQSVVEQRRDGRQAARDDRRDWRDDRQDRRDDRRWDNNRGADRRWDNDRRDNDRRWDNNNSNRDWNRGWRNDRRYGWQDYRSHNRNIYRVPRYYAPRGYAYGYRRWSPGYRMEPFFYSSSYWISDPWDYRLPPAYGPYRWVRYYDDVLLIDIRTGLIEDIIHDFFWR